MFIEIDFPLFPKSLLYRERRLRQSLVLLNFDYCYTGGMLKVPQHALMLTSLITCAVYRYCLVFRSSDFSCLEEEKTGFQLDLTLARGHVMTLMTNNVQSAISV